MRSTAKRLFRVGSLFAPTILAWLIALSAPHRDELTRAVTAVLGPLWMVFVGACAFRILTRVVRRGSGPIALLDRLDVLTEAGWSLAWLSSFAIIGAVWIGWASLAAVGLLGAAVLHLVVLLTLFTLRDGSNGAIVRRFSATSPTEGDDLTEEISVDDVRIPIGFRLFITGRLGPRWATTRHVLESSESNAEVVLESEIGPAIRGEHNDKLLQVWFEDTFGLCRSPVVHVAPSSLSVLPRMRPLERPPLLLDRGQGARPARREMRLPTEGAFNLREYQQGDDVRRIHWVRSLAAEKLIVRLPDELPPDMPRVRLVLDTFFPETLVLTGDMPGEVLDLLVATWLGVARSLAEAGVRVTLVTATSNHEGVVMAKRQAFALRTPNAALRLGAQVAWQSRIQVSDLLTDEATFVVSRGVLMVPPSDPKFRWIVVVPHGISEPSWELPSSALVPHPMGHPENRWSFRSKAIRELAAARRDHDQTIRLMAHASIARPPPGSLVAHASTTGIRLGTIA